jgi:hypothetical protein
MSTDTKADDIVTDEMVDVALAAFDELADSKGHGFTNLECVHAALRAVAPMIRDEVTAAEREACAWLAEVMGNDPQLAAAIRARGETT